MKKLGFSNFVEYLFNSDFSYDLVTNPRMIEIIEL